jgi:hypothetical protein
VRKRGRKYSVRLDELIRDNIAYLETLYEWQIQEPVGSKEGFKAHHSCLEILETMHG